MVFTNSSELWAEKQINIITILIILLILLILIVIISSSSSSTDSSFAFEDEKTTERYEIQSF